MIILCKPVTVLAGFLQFLILSIVGQALELRLKDASMGNKILVIDDEKMMLRLVSAILSRAGYVVNTAGSIPDALAVLAVDTVDLITCDLMLPEVSGLDFLKMMQDGQVTPAVPVVVVTAAGFQSELENARALGAAFVLNKPFTAQQLTDVVESILNPQPGG